MRLNRNSWSSTSSIWPSLSARTSRASLAMCWIPRDQVRGRRPALRRSGLEYVERGIGNLAGQQSLDELHLGGGSAGRVGQMPGQNRLACAATSPPMPDRRPAWSAASASRSATASSNCSTTLATDSRLAARSFAVTASSKTVLDGAISSSSSRKRSTVADLLRRIGNEVAHHIACAMHGLGAETLPKLADELLAQQLNLLPTLGFDAFQLGVGLGSQLLGDLLGVVPRLVDHLRRLGLGFFQRLGVLVVGVGDLLLRLGVVGELRYGRSPAGSSSWCGPAAQRISRPGRR